MRYLLDTNAALWWFQGSNRFKKSLRDSLTDHANAVFISAVSTCEISIKAAIGKLALARDPRSYLAPRIVRAGFAFLPVLAEHLTIVSADRFFAQYDVCTIAL